MRRAMTPGDDRRKQRARRDEVQSLLDQHRRLVDAPHHERIEHKSRGEEREMLPST